jgi:hypothetical protein
MVSAPSDLDVSLFCHIVSKKGPILSSRNTHDWLWYLLFGGVSVLVSMSHGDGVTIEIP